ncbi:response regulator transcription factor (plasmid) [Peteryoungia desertarenae]|uniref:Cell cycle response regulator CtrA n=1 Tax=Peteryoungia desertarenae TaxID=1813451 RepID=A0ABX6QT58_9HYPH|nr:response regulator transcription factor [Peteryoungia desertarenae]QLF71653.1 response regulator transcription factor [Peteryoungia desertarenae]
MNILLIEDDVRVADFLVRGLQAEGYGTNWVRSGKEGLAAAEAFARDCERQDLPGVVILDVLLPELDGLSLCQMLRKRNHQVPILMLSAMGESHERADGLRRGADDYLAKPFDFDELLARIEALMRRTRRRVQPRPLQIGTIILDRQLPGLRTESDEVALSALEMAMMELMVASAGATVSRERILARVWQADRDPLTNVVDVYVSRLRRKIARLDPEVRITAVRGLGYRLGVQRL